MEALDHQRVDCCIGNCHWRAIRLGLTLLVAIKIAAHNIARLASGPLRGMKFLFVHAYQYIPLALVSAMLRRFIAITEG